jgi:DNA-binding response OmpR family regulator
MNQKIMLIEDDHTMLGLLQTLLTLEGFQVIAAEDEPFDQLISKIDTEQPNTILMDINLRQGNGLDLLHAIRSNPARQNIRVIMSSGSDYKDECLENGAQAFLMKPYMPDDLIKITGKTTENI